MKKFFSLVLCMLLLLCNTTTSIAETFYPNKQAKKTAIYEDLTFSPERIIVKFKNVSSSTFRLASTNTFASYNLNDLGIDTKDIRLINPSNTTSTSARGMVACSNEESDQNNTYVITLKDSGADAVQNAIETLCTNPNVEYAVRDIYLKTCAIPNDEGYTSTSYNTLNHINAHRAWDITTGSKDVVVGIIDTGFDGKHEDLKDNLWVNPNPNRNGYKNDIHGYDFGNHKGGIPTDQNQHGTHVAGIVGAKGNNSIGVCGVAWNVQLAWLRIADETGNMSLSHAVEAINYANNNNIPILNASWGDYACYNNWDEFKPLMEAIKNYKGLFIAAAGNDRVCNDTYPFYPASFDLPNIISVGSSSIGFSVPENLLAIGDSGYSNYGDSVDIMAPGTDVYSTMPNNNYDLLSGTSMASPQVAGVAALVKAKYPHYTSAQLKSAILNGATKNATFLVHFLKDGAALNAYGALLETKPTPESLQIRPVDSTFTVEAGQTMKLYTNITPLEADQTVTWHSDNTDIVEMTADGCYIAHKEGTATITATSAINKNCKQSVTIIVTPQKSTVVEFADKNLKNRYLYELNRISVNLQNGIRYQESKIYLSDTASATWLELRGTNTTNLEDLKYFTNLENLIIEGNALTGSVNLTYLKKLEQLRINSVITNTPRPYYYTKKYYNYALKELKATIDGKPVNLKLKGSGFIEVHLRNFDNGDNKSLVEIFYEASHKPVSATLNGKTLYPTKPFVTTYYFNFNSASNFNFEIQPGINIQNPRTYQNIGNKLRKIDPNWYNYFDWQSGYKLTAEDVSNFFIWKPMCAYDLERAGIENPKASLSKTSYSYSGKTRTPKVTVKDIDNYPLRENKDYKVTYSSGRKKVGTYYVTVKFKGKYSGTKKLSFKINPKKTSVSKVTAGKKSLKVSIKKQTKQVTGYEVQYSTSKKFSGAKTKAIKTTSLTIKSLKAKKTYYVRVRTYKTIKGKKYYSGWSSAKSKKTK